MKFACDNWVVVLKNKNGSKAQKSTTITQYRPKGSKDKVLDWNGQIWINPEQYFTEVSKEAWDFYIGGYKPAQKWLKDRKGSCLSNEEVLHYGKLLYALEETIRIMNEIDTIDFL